MLDDDDKRVLPAVMTGLVRAKAPEAAEALLSHLKDADFALRASAARLLGELKAPGGAEALREAFKAAQPDSAPDARTAILSALVAYGAAEATDTLKSALADKDWSVRRHAVGLLTGLDPAGSYLETIRPAPGAPTLAYNSPDLIAPPFSPHVFIETVRHDRVRLTALDAPQTTRNFVRSPGAGSSTGCRSTAWSRTSSCRTAIRRRRRRTSCDPRRLAIARSVRIGYGAVRARHRRQPVLHHRCSHLGALYGLRLRRQRDGGVDGSAGT